MKLLLLAVALLILYEATHAQVSGQVCAATLRPNEESISSDRRSFQAYMYQNAESEYDRIESLDSNQRSLDAVYKVARVEYADSANRTDFAERVRSRMRREGYTQSSSDIEAVRRSFVTDSQLNAFVSCLAATGAPSVRLLARSPSTSKPFPLRVVVQPGAGRTTLDVTVSVVGGTSSGPGVSPSSAVHSFVAAQGGYAFVVTPSPVQGRTILTANASGIPDEWHIDEKPAAIPPTEIDKMRDALLPYLNRKLNVRQAENGMYCRSGDWCKSGNCKGELRELDAPGFCLSTTEECGWPGEQDGFRVGKIASVAGMKFVCVQDPQGRRTWLRQ